MEWTPDVIQALTPLFSSVITIASTVSVILWARSESRADHRALDAKLESNRIETQSWINSLRVETKASIDAIKAEATAFQNAMQQETKEFHGRLCKIEESRK